MEEFTQNDLQGAYLVNKTQLVLLHPSDKIFVKMVRRTSWITNFLSGPLDVITTNLIYGSDLGDWGKGSESKEEYTDEEIVSMPWL